MSVQLAVGNLVTRNAFCNNSKMVKNAISANDARELVANSTTLGFVDVTSRLTHRQLVLVTVVSADYIEGLIVNRKHGRSQFYVILHEY